MRKILKRAAGLAAVFALTVSILVGVETPAVADGVATTTAQTATGSSGQALAVARHTKRKSSSAAKGRKALAFARTQVGDRYRWGAAGPSAWDCSGLTMKAWRRAGVKLPHHAGGQLRKGQRIKRSQLRKGDLVFFYGGVRHVGIYAGHGKVIHASRPGKPVGYASIRSMPYKGASRPR